MVKVTVACCCLEVIVSCYRSLGVEVDLWLLHNKPLAQHNLPGGRETTTSQNQLELNLKMALEMVETHLSRSSFVVLRHYSCMFG